MHIKLKIVVQANVVGVTEHNDMPFTDGGLNVQFESDMDCTLEEYQELHTNTMAIINEAKEAVTGETKEEPKSCIYCAGQGCNHCS